MKILHYSLGFPPYRSGGMTTFCINLIEEQCKQGHIVSMMWPGVYSLKNKKALHKEDLKEYQNIFINEDIKCFF